MDFTQDFKPINERIYPATDHTHVIYIMTSSISDLLWIYFIWLLALGLVQWCTRAHTLIDQFSDELRLTLLRIFFVFSFFFCKLQLNDFFISVVVGKYHSMPEALWALSMSTPFISVPSSNYYGSLVQWWCRLGRKRNSVLISTETRDRFFTQLLLLFGVSSNQSHRKCRPHANKSPQYQCLIISAQCFVHSNWNKRNNACWSPGCHRNRAFRVQRR